MRQQQNDGRSFYNGGEGVANEFEFKFSVISQIF